MPSEWRKMKKWSLSMAEQRATFVQRSLEKVYFEHKEMDYYLSWVLGRQLYEGCDPAECMQVAERIEDGDPQSWQDEWRKQAELTEAHAQALLEAGEEQAARRAFLHACTYYRAPLFIMGPEHADFTLLWKKMRACFKLAAALFEPPIEQLKVAYQNTLLEGYAWCKSPGGQRLPTLIVVGGIETFAEDCYFMVGMSAAERGYSLLSVDLPGQGANPQLGLYFGAQMQTPVQVVVDYALSRPDVDPQRLAIWGFSWGGHVVFKGAQHEPRLRAMVANPPMPDVFRAAWAQQGGQNRSDPVAKAVFNQIAWRMGLKISFNPRDIARRFGKAYDYFVNGKADPRQINCPALLMAGEGEAPITLQIARECYEQLPNPKKKLVIFTREQCGEAHCQVNNLGLPNEVMFDWLNEVLECR